MIRAVLSITIHVMTRSITHRWPAAGCVNQSRSDRYNPRLGRRACVKAVCFRRQLGATGEYRAPNAVESGERYGKDSELCWVVSTAYGQRGQEYMAKAFILP